jgi:hypothetical protein
MSGTLSPVGKQYFTDSNGAPLSGGKVSTYLAGSSTPATTYSDSALTTANSNPIILDSSGRCTIYLQSSSYKYVVQDAADRLIWTQDNIASVAAQAVLGEIFSFGGDSSAPVTATTYTVGTGYAALAFGSAIYRVDSVDLGGTYVLVGMLSAPVGQTITASIMNLSDGSPETPLASISTTDTTGVRVESGAITFAASGAAKNYGIKIIVTGGTGFGWAFSLVRTN